MVVENYICKYDKVVVQYYLPIQEKIVNMGFLTLENSKRATTNKAVGRWLIKNLKN